MHPVLRSVQYFIFCSEGIHVLLVYRHHQEVRLTCLTQLGAGPSLCRYTVYSVL